MALPVPPGTLKALSARSDTSIAHRFARLVEHAVLTPPLTYKAIVHRAT